MPDKKLTDVTDIKVGKMTDSEIVKALECCIKWKREGDCAKCPLYESDKLCVKEIRILALDLINRLQAKNSNLTSDLTSLQNDLTSAKAENERLKKGWKADVILTANVKAEAYKEFADKLENEVDCQLRSKSMEASAERYKIKRFINNLLKELVGE